MPTRFHCLCACDLKYNKLRFTINLTWCPIFFQHFCYCCCCNILLRRSSSVATRHYPFTSPTTHIQAHVSRQTDVYVCMFVNIYVCFCVVVYALHARTIFATALWLIVSPFKLIKSTFIIYLLLLKLKLLRLPFPFLYLLLRRVFIYLNLCHIFPDFSPNACMSVRCICCCRKISIKLLYACDTRPQSDCYCFYSFVCIFVAVCSVTVIYFFAIVWVIYISDCQVLRA